MPKDEYIEKFIHILQLLIFVLLFGCCYTNIKNLLDKARNIEDMKKDIMVNFPSQEKFDTLKLNQGSKKSAKESAGFAKSAKLATRSTDTQKGSAEAN